jgi:RHH-type proline utilization regulon transcriptional repressor/proline dehydrogenase/delta 1-pyrroline-5-carboxylate dehydrogenase
MRRPQDPTGLEAEANAFRYRALRRVALMAGAGVDPADLDRARTAAATVGVEVTVTETVTAIAGVDKLRVLGPIDAATRAAAIETGVWFDDLPVATDPARELQRWAREQAVSESRHRHGDITRRRPGLV